VGCTWVAHDFLGLLPPWAISGAVFEGLTKKETMPMKTTKATNSKRSSSIEITNGGDSMKKYIPVLKRNLCICCCIELKVIIRQAERFLRLTRDESVPMQMKILLQQSLMGDVEGYYRLHREHLEAVGESIRRDLQSILEDSGRMIA
jgi:hypothetical protein